MKIPQKKRSLFIPAMFAIAAVLSGICFASHASGTSTVISRCVSFVATPVTVTARGAFSLVENASGYFKSIDNLKKENELLSQENKKLTEQNDSFKELEKENDRLYKFLDLKKERTDYDFVDAKVISKSSSNYVSTFTLDKGSFHGIKENMPIITSNGALMGVTYSVDSNSCRCISIISYDTKVGIYDSETGETGILSGSFDRFAMGQCIIQGVSNEALMKPGDKIFTSGLGTIYPRNLKIGVVKEFLPEKGSQTKSVVIDVDNSIFSDDSVMILTDFERIYE